jgi:hypothetical protein
LPMKFLQIGQDYLAFTKFYPQSVQTQKWPHGMINVFLFSLKHIRHSSL